MPLLPNASFAECQMASVQRMSMSDDKQNQPTGHVSAEGALAIEEHAESELRMLLDSSSEKVATVVLQYNLAQVSTKRASLARLLVGTILHNFLLWSRAVGLGLGTKFTRQERFPDAGQKLLRAFYESSVLHLVMTKSAGDNFPAQSDETDYWSTKTHQPSPKKTARHFK